jgi:hypothetical protein
MQTITLIGAEVVELASSNMQSAVEQMSRAAANEEE